jgi:hypothetical protein
VPQPKFQYGNAIFGHMGSSKEASQIMSNILAWFFHVFVA